MIENPIRQSKYEERDATVRKYVISAIVTNLSGETNRFPTNAEIVTACDITPRILATSLKRIRLAPTVHELRVILTKKDRAAALLRSSLAKAKQDPHVGIISYPDIAEQVGIDISGVADAARDSGLKEPLKEAREAARKKEITQSQEAAWMLGMIVGAGNVRNNPDNHTITVSSKNIYALDAFQKSGERIFGIKGIRRERDDADVLSINFNNASYARALGNLSGDEKARIINKNHSWVMTETYIASFVSGVFDARGNVELTDKKRSINFHTTSKDIADFYRQMLIALGIHNARIIRSPNAPEGVRGVRFGILADLQLFATRIKSVKPDAQEKLDKIKLLEGRQVKALSTSTVIDVYPSLL